MIDDPHMHTAFLAILSDSTSQGARPLAMDPDDFSGIISLDHSVWFHRPARADEWIHYDIHSVVNTNGRGLLHGSMYDEQGVRFASVAQETLLFPPES